MTGATWKLKLRHCCQHGSADTTSAILGALRELCVEQGLGWIAEQAPQIARKLRRFCDPSIGPAVIG
jgi:hypothetical protein